MNTDRRRTNAPSAGTAALVFARTVKEPGYLQSLRPSRTREPDELRRIFLQTNLIPSATGSAYYEIPLPRSPTTSTLIPSTSTLKILASVQGPKPLPRSAPFSPTLLLTTTVKFAPFATRHRRGYIRDSVERDLGVHVESALRGVIIGERWPKSGVDVVLTILEADEDGWWGDGNAGKGDGSGWGLLNVLAGCITVASAAIADAGIDCVDLVAGGVAAMVKKGEGKEGEVVKVLDPSPTDHKDIVAACAVGYLAGRDEITEMWMKGNVGAASDELVEGAIYASLGNLGVMKEVLLETLKSKIRAAGQEDVDQTKGSPPGDVEMTG
ncbi:exoribonuclease family protein [Sporormia fimetaria CBS 119925]|uniref:Exoribonuclease family protein n=1 Tax=Sporormia fimetaria CBS 119925 TaxID=1340428 RepID=A0A6A6V2Z4_9PLEO|nr:exoribonuclease family protein [Sporormia fimetaria CBS 119925]